MKALLRAGADVQCQDKDKSTALFKAVESENLALIEELVQSGADINHLDAVRSNYVYTVARIMYLSIVKTWCT